MYSPYTTHRLTVRQKIRQLNWGLIFVLTATAAIGVAMLYSAGDVGELKVEVAQERLERVNPDIRIACLPERLDLSLIHI